jgi:rubrerythrin
MEVGQVGQACYRLLADRTRYPRVRALLIDMAQEEAAHRAAWAALCDGHADTSVRSEEEWQEYQQYVRAAARSALPYAPDQVLATAERAAGERDVVGIAKELAGSMTRFVSTLCGTASLDGARSIAERIVSDKESRLHDLEKMLWSTAPEDGRARHSQVGLDVALSAEERVMSPLAPVTAGG